MTNTIYVRPVFMDEELVESETNSECGHDDGVEGSSRADMAASFLSVTRMNCFAAARSASDKQEENNDHHEALLNKTKPGSISPNPKLITRNFPNRLIGEQLAAGWPSWICTNASEAIKGWIPRHADGFENPGFIFDPDEIDQFWWDIRALKKEDRFTLIDQSKNIDTLTKKEVVIKQVRVDSSDPDGIMRSMAEEILILRRLDHPNVIKLEGLVISEQPFTLSFVFERVDYGWAATKVFSEPQAKCYMNQLLSGLEHCHSRGVFHNNIKRSDVLCNNMGVLKITGFGSVSVFIPWETSSYRAPELLLFGSTDIDGAGVDLWSAGCILAELLIRMPLFLPHYTKEEHLDRIFLLCGRPSEEYLRNSKPGLKGFKPTTRDERKFCKAFPGLSFESRQLLGTLLKIDPAQRQTATSALSSQFFTSKPDACKPWALPSYRYAIERNIGAHFIE